jgi:hypothetical protein
MDIAIPLAGLKWIEQEARLRFLYFGRLRERIAA